ncbi:unnamed protein product [Acanthoscelides obtectus]|uniref:Uncharacterized protein n=1 Tax=Acanthoscelides obtectus TaxID=200917 RepID=A0A9P0PE02_ACAOB|nr:unnamed protein product [Acanthoscelides obtectus]CAK1672424.1 hypothetical protein AOBTE_LOCUS28878 [Acanthoscelides obtectus]
MRRKNENIYFLSFLTTLAEELISEGIQNTSLPLPKQGLQEKENYIVHHHYIFLWRDQQEEDPLDVLKRKNKQEQNSLRGVQYSIVQVLFHVVSYQVVI